MGLEQRLNDKAWLVFNLSMKRAKHQCPPWARTSKMRRSFVKIYKKSARKNHFSSACGRDGEKYEVDHVIPLHGENVSGLHVPWNLRVILKTINRSKGILIVPDDEWLLRCCGGRYPNGHKIECKYAPKSWFTPWGGIFG